MAFEIRNHRIVGANYVRSPNQSGYIKPAGAIMHWTAGATAASAIGTFKNRSSRASAHFVIHPDGDVTQMVDLNRKAWHAGPSILNGRRNCNSWTHGFEITNPGFYTIKNGEYWDWSGRRRIRDKELAMWQPIHNKKMGRLGDGTYGFPEFKEAQIETCLGLLAAIKSEYYYDTIAGHDEIDTRGWKADPGPLFPWDRFDALMGSKVERPDIAKEPPREAPPKGTDKTRGDGTPSGKMVVRVPSLNVRQGPGTKWRKLTSIPKGTVVNVLRDTGDWSRISFNGGKIGWVADKYLETV